MKYTLKGKKLKYQGFAFDICITAISAVICLSTVVALIFKQLEYYILWGVLFAGFVLNVLLAVKHFISGHRLWAVINIVAATCLLLLTVLGGITIFS